MPESIVHGVQGQDEAGEQDAFVHPWQAKGVDFVPDGIKLPRIVPLERFFPRFVISSVMLREPSVVPFQAVEHVYDFLIIGIVHGGFEIAVAEHLRPFGNVVSRCLVSRLGKGLGDPRRAAECVQHGMHIKNRDFLQDMWKKSQFRSGILDAFCPGDIRDCFSQYP